MDGTPDVVGLAPDERAAVDGRFAMPLHEFHRIDRGRLTHTWHREGWFGWLHQVGAWPPAPSTTPTPAQETAR